MSEKLFLIDGHSHLFQAFFAIKGLTGPDGTPTNAVLGFTKMLQKLIREQTPDYLAVAFDVGKPTFRHEQYPDYKANRPPAPPEYDAQVPIVYELLRAFRIPIYTKEGYEADDLLGTIAKQVAAENDGVETVIVTSDKDADQLLDEQITVLNATKNRLKTVDTLRKEKGIAPEQLIDVMALAGDSSDNVPGVPKIGPKTALELIHQFGSMEAVLANTDKIKQKKRRENLEQFADQARLSKRLVTIDTDVDLDFDLNECRLKEPDAEALKELYQRLGFNRLLSDLMEPETEAEETAYHTVDTEEAFDSFLAALKKQERFSVDIETTSLSPIDAEIVGLSFAWKEREAYYLPIRGPEGANLLDEKRTLAALKPLLEDEKAGKIGQNIKYDALVLRNADIHLKGIVFDTMVAAYLCGSGSRRYNLDDLALTHLGHRNIPITDLIGGGKDQKSMADIDVAKVSEYACEDADITLRLANVLEEELKGRELLNLFHGVEAPLISVLTEMEWNGVKVDVDFLKAMSADLDRQLQALEKDIYEEAGEEFNISSTKQLGEILYDKLGLEVPEKRKTKKRTQRATDADTLQLLAAQNDEKLPALVIEYRKLSKLKSTYVDALPAQVNARDGKIHASFNQTATATGRLSSSEPNLQNIPIKTELGRTIRRAFVPSGDGQVLLTADYSQIELRVLAHFCGDETLVKAFKNDLDIHRFVASQIFGVDQKDVTTEMRYRAKTINFSVIYGKTPFGLSKELGVPVHEAKQFIDSYFDRYRRVREFIEETLSAARTNGYVSTLLGRRRYFSALISSKPVERSAAERAAFNAVIQGTAADMIKVAMNDVYGHLQRKEMRTRMILQIHDELVFEVPKVELPEAHGIIEKDMRSAITLDVPVKVNIAVGDNWLEAE
ncbi:MAG: DNA polymerase I [Planctomycetes bacterium]|nr:DNA polymerase I [Planctomycetota bacterium]